MRSPLCEIIATASGHACPKCRLPVALTAADLAHIENDLTRVYRPCTGPFPIGDWIANGLARVGITERRISWILGRRCHCNQRRQWLNRQGAKIGHALAAARRGLPRAANAFAHAAAQLRPPR